MKNAVFFGESKQILVPEKKAKRFVYQLQKEWEYIFVGIRNIQQ